MSDKIISHPLPTHKTFKNLTGHKFGRLTVVSYAGKRGHSQTWNCLCVCGNTVVSRACTITSGRAKSCGCYQREGAAERAKTHGMRNTKIYRCWDSMKERCYNKNNIGYVNYGGRGIKVCDRWINSFENFYADMGDRPSPSHSIDRINNYGDYSHENCHWTTSDIQGRNQRLRKDNKTGIRGVSLAKSGRFMASIRVNWKAIHLGTHDTIEEAAQARKDGELKYWDKIY